MLLGFTQHAARSACLLPRLLLSMSSTTSGGPSLVLDPFAHRQFNDPERSDYIPMGGDEFASRVNAAFESGAAPLVDGYAPFCKHVFVENFAGATGAVVKITPENESLLRSEYDARREDELPILLRYFPAAGAPTPQVSKYLDVILYSREQINKEAAAMADKAAAMGRDEHDDGGSPWGIISVKAQDVDYELPMQPITMMRNALGKSEGGSGVPLAADKYRESVAFWSEHAPLK